MRDFESFSFFFCDGLTNATCLLVSGFVCLVLFLHFFYFFFYSFLSTLFFHFCWDEWMGWALKLDMSSSYNASSDDNRQPDDIDGVG